ncbi:hypothetical protein UJ101_00051 [Flavobacteriaceae bacterium UJ101]|nr:hypothetical protein UJ101_00051 [Flavobacteriaceae bacterium UJ101]
MKKISFIISATLLSVFFFVSCEDDQEICGEDTTARLIIKFYDEATNEVASKSGVISTTEFTDYTFSSQDSIQLPLSLNNSVDTLFYRTSTNATDVDTIALSFTRTEEYVSKGCGFKINYTNVSATLGTSSKTLKKLEWNPNLVDANNQISITNETEAQMFIYF